MYYIITYRLYITWDIHFTWSYIDHVLLEIYILHGHLALCKCQKKTATSPVILLFFYSSWGCDMLKYGSLYVYKEFLGITSLTGPLQSSR